MIAREIQLIALTPAADHTGKEGYAVKNVSGTAAIVVSASATRPLGVITEGAATTGKDSLALAGFGGTVKVKLHSSPGTVNAFDYLEIASDGTFKVASGTTGNYKFAQALEAGSANELIEARLIEPVAQ